MSRLLALPLLAACAAATVLHTTPDRNLADAGFLKRQKQVLDLFVGIGHNEHFKNEFADWDINANIANWADEKYPKNFMAAYKRGLMPHDGIFSPACHHTMHDAIKLFDLFYFAKDFDTFYKAASWARSVVNPGMFVFAYSMALHQRPDTRDFALPPLYEVLPNYFVPMDTLHQAYDFKMTGRKEGRFNFNNTGYEHNYHTGMFGGLLDPDNRGYGDFRISYWREDVGLNHWFTAWLGRNPSWMCPEKYPSVRFHRRGENFYYFLQQIFARYTLERLANGLPYTTVLDWHRPIQVGYNPRLTYLNGLGMVARPDNLVPWDFSPRKIKKTEQYEKRIWDVIDAGMLWEISNQSLVPLKEDTGAEMLGRLMYGTTDRPSRNYYKSLYYAGLDALAYMVSSASDRSYIGNAMSTPMTALRDPAFYNYIARILLPFQHYKKSLRPYSVEEMAFEGVTVDAVEVDRMLTYFEMSDFEMTNGVPMMEPRDYMDHRYMARQYRLNHKPFRYNVTVSSQAPGEAIVRVFLGPKYDSDDRLLTPDQARLAFFEIDRFITKMSAGSQTWERSSTESPVFVSDQDGFRSLYASVNNAINNKGEFYYYKGGRCGMPERLMLPMGWKGGRAYRMFVAISPWKGSEEGASGHMHDIACGGSALYDGRAMGFPFDRPLSHDFHDIHNFYFKDVHIYHKDAADLNRIVA